MGARNSIQLFLRTSSGVSTRIGRLTCGGAGTPGVCACSPRTCADAGADCLYAPGIKAREDIAAIVAAANIPKQ